MTPMMKRLCETFLDAQDRAALDPICADDLQEAKLIVTAILQEMLEMDESQFPAIEKVTPRLGAAAYIAGIEAILGEKS